MSYIRFRGQFIWPGCLLAVSLFLMVCFGLKSGFAQPPTPPATSNLYYLLPGEGLAEVARKYALDLRTIQCLNPGWTTRDRQVALPLVSAQRHPVTVPGGQTLPEIARLYRTDPGLITAYPLNFWAGCEVSPALDPQKIPPGRVIYVPGAAGGASLASSRPGGGALPPGQQSQLVDYQPEQNPAALLANPFPAVFRLPNSTTTTSSTVTLPSQVPGDERRVQPVVKLVPAPPAKGSDAPLLSGSSSVSATPGPGGGMLIWPIRGIITTRFSARHPGIDIATAYGTPVVAVKSGMVFGVSRSAYGYGNFVQIDHGDGWYSHYAHLSRFAVSPGQMVSAGEIIGYEGVTGNSTGPHLHFELVIAGRYVNPLEYLRPE